MLWNEVRGQGWAAKGASVSHLFLSLGRDEGFCRAGCTGKAFLPRGQPTLDVAGAGTAPPPPYCSSKDCPSQA